MASILSAGVTAILDVASELGTTIFGGLIGIFVGLGVIGGIVRIFR